MKQHTNPDGTPGPSYPDSATVDPSAIIGARASIGEGARIGEGASIGEWASIGARARIGEGASIGEWASIGEGASCERDAIASGHLLAWVWSSWILPDLTRWLRYGCESHPIDEWTPDAIAEMSLHHVGEDLAPQYVASLTALVALCRTLPATTCAGDERAPKGGA